MRILASAILLFCFPAFAQQQGPITPPPLPAASIQKLTEPAPTANPPVVRLAIVTIPAGTRLFMKLAHPLSTKSARVGDPIYLQTTDPVSIGNELAIPRGTFVQGTLSKVARSGWIHRRVQLQMRLTDVIFANGYMASLPDQVPLEPGSEGNFHPSPGSRTGAIVSAIAFPAAGAGIGAAEGGEHGAALGGGVGAAAGAIIGIAMLHHNDNVTLQAGTQVSAVLQHPLIIEESRILSAASASHGPEVALARPLWISPLRAAAH